MVGICLNRSHRTRGGQAAYAEFSSLGSFGAGHRPLSPRAEIVLDVSYFTSS